MSKIAQAPDTDQFAGTPRCKTAMECLEIRICQYLSSCFITEANDLSFLTYLQISEATGIDLQTVRIVCGNLYTQGLVAQRIDHQYGLIVVSLLPSGWSIDDAKAVRFAPAVSNAPASMRGEGSALPQKLVHLPPVYSVVTTDANGAVTNYTDEAGMSTTAVLLPYSVTEMAILQRPVFPMEPFPPPSVTVASGDLMPFFQSYMRDTASTATPLSFLRFARRCFMHQYATANVSLAFADLLANPAGVFLSPVLVFATQDKDDPNTEDYDLLANFAPQWQNSGFSSTLFYGTTLSSNPALAFATINLTSDTTATLVYVNNFRDRQPTTEPVPLTFIGQLQGGIYHVFSGGNPVFL